MNILDLDRRANPARNTDGLDASLYDRYASKFSTLDLPEIVGELQGWSETTPLSQSVAAMARLLDLAIMSNRLNDRDRRKSARLAIVMEQIVRRTLIGNAQALTTIEGAYRLLLHFGQANSPSVDIVSWIREERLRRGLAGVE